MQHQHYPMRYGPYPPPHNPGLMGLFGSVIGLATTAVYSSAVVVRTVVEGSSLAGRPRPGLRPRVRVPPRAPLLRGQLLPAFMWLRVRSRSLVSALVIMSSGKER